MSTTRMCNSREPPDQGHLVSVRPRLKFLGRGGTSDGSRSGSRVGMPSFDDDLSSQSSSVATNQQVTALKHLLDSELAKAPSSSASSSVESFGPVHVQVPLPAQTQAQQMPMPDKDLQIALLEEELTLVKRMAELEKRKQDAKLTDVQVKSSNEALSGFGSIEVVSEPNKTREDVFMFQQIENARRDEISRLMDVKSKESLCKTKENKVTKQQIRHMLERKKNEMILRSEMMHSSASSLQKNIGNVDTQEIFESEESDLEDTFAMGAVKSTRYERYDDDPHRTGCVDIGSFRGDDKVDFLHRTDTVDMGSILGENAREQQMILDKIQRERREEEENLKGMKHQEVVKEQEMILRQIQEQNIAKKKEEELTFKLLAEMSLNDQQQMMQPSAKATNTKAPAPTPFVSSAAFPPLESYTPAGAWGGGGWSVVGEKAKERHASIKYAAEMDLRKKQKAAQTEAMQEWRKGMMVREEEERRRQLRRWEESQKVKVVKNGDKIQGSEVTGGAAVPCPTLREFLVEGAGQSRGSRGKGNDGQGGNRELGARRKSDSWQESLGDRRRISENQKSRVDAQEREYLARAEQVALSQEWENATKRKEARGASASRAQEEAGAKSKNKKYLSQKTRQR